MRRLRSALTGESGAAGGLEGLAFGVLIFLVGTLVVAGAWGVVDTKLAVTAAAREAARAFVEAPAGSDAEAIATAAARTALVAHGRGNQLVATMVEGDLSRCARVQVTVSAAAPALALPWIGAWGATTTSSTAAEIVDPLRSGLAGEATCVAR